MNFIYFKLKFLRYKFIFLFFILFLISRIFFINTQGVFFDSKEYFNLFTNPNYLVAITNGHFPPHEGYIILFWPLFQLINYFHGNATYAVILGQIILSFFTLYCFYAFIKYIANTQIAIYAVILASLTPLFWIINVTLMMENAYAAFYFVSLLLLIKYLKNNKKTPLLHLSLLIYSLAIVTQTIVILWAPLYLFVVYIKQKKLFAKVLIYMIIYFATFSVINVIFISNVIDMQPQITFRNLYLSKASEFSALQFDLKGILIFGRNFLIPLFRNNSILLVLLSLLSLIILYKKNIKLFFIGVLFILPAIYTNQWWDSLLNGRHALLAGFGIAFLVACLLQTKRFVFFLVIIYLLIVSVPALNLLRYPIPYLQEAQYAKSFPKNALFIESHFARPQVQDTVKARTIWVNEPAWPIDKLTQIINSYLDEKRDVYISSAALSEPYGLYSGPYLHNITLSYISPPILQPVLTHDKFKLYKTLNAADNLYIYQITSTSGGSYPASIQLQNSYRRIDYTDPLSFLFRLVEPTFSHELQKLYSRQ
jgi:hypothetical protein